MNQQVFSPCKVCKKTNHLSKDCKYGCSKCAQSTPHSKTYPCPVPFGGAKAGKAGKPVKPPKAGNAVTQGKKLSSLVKQMTVERCLIAHFNR